MTYQLIPIEKGRSPAIALQRPVLLIGRHPECDVRIDLPKISRRHCCLALAYDRVLIRDLGSHNGLRVNGRVVEEARLHAGDEVAIGPIIYRLEIEAMKPATPNSPPARPASAPQKLAERSPVAASRPPAPVPISPDSEIDLVSLDDLEL
jgi:predicted component of type VI protein secretion system